jgi:hypothetical protein
MTLLDRPGAGKFLVLPDAVGHLALPVFLETLERNQDPHPEELFRRNSVSKDGVCVRPSRRPLRGLLRTRAWSPAASPESAA